MRKIILLIGLIVWVLQLQAQINMNQGLQLYLPFNGNAQDASGNGNNGLVSGATLTADQNGAPNSAYYFDGVNDKIDITNSPSLNPTIMTVCAKVKMQGFYNGLCYNNVILTKGGDGNSPVAHYSLRTTATNTNSDCNLQDTANHNYRFDVNGNGALTMNTINMAPHVVTNSWDCLIGTYDGTTHKLYVNGVLRYSNPVASKPSNASILTIGWHSEHTLYPYWFNGIIDEVRIYNRVLNSSEISYYCTIPFPQSTEDVSRKLPIQLYPNPSENDVTIGLENLQGSVQLRLTNIEGRLLLKKKFTGGNKSKLDIAHLTKGLYFFHFEKDGNTRVIKFQKN